MYLFQMFNSYIARCLVVLLTMTLSQVVAVAQDTAGAPTPKSSVLAQHDPSGAKINANDVLSELQYTPEAERKAMLAKPETVQQIAINLLVRRVLAAEAERDGASKDPLVGAALTIARDRVMSDARIARLDVQNAPSEAALEAYAQSAYKASGTRFEQPAQTRVRHILIDNKGPESLKKANELLAQLRSGASFEDLAKANSTDSGSAARGGDLGFFGAGKMVRPFEDAVNALAKPGDLSGPVETQFGLHIIRLEERKEKGPRPYNEVRSQLITEARAAIMTESRLLKVGSLHKDFVFDKQAIEALTKPVAR
ncbi:MAG: peptidylprolyl isomerase [Rhodoferax sp.]